MEQPVPSARRYTVAEYLALEDAAAERHEYSDGEILAMAVVIVFDTVNVVDDGLPGIAMRSSTNPPPHTVRTRPARIPRKAIHG